MVMLNNENVSIDDRVYDIIHGYGSVIDTTFNEIAVRFDTGVRIAFSSDGSYGGIRRLYWHNPIIVDPPKDSKLWEVLKSCLKTMHDYLKTK